MLSYIKTYSSPDNIWWLFMSLTTYLWNVVDQADPPAHPPPPQKKKKKNPQTGSLNTKIDRIIL